MKHELTHIKLLQKSKKVLLTFDGERVFELPCEYLRVYSPSAEVRGHGKSVLQTNKKNVNIISIEPVGNYAVKLMFDDGHQTGIYSFETLHDLSINYHENWQHYVEQLDRAGLSREEK
ncbi:MAG: DUF971 domain-containing protein [Gammaproteobacteria bacterium]|nr:DUF971 domain-containing protein [Gammaproteobacteria bacterium]